MVNKTQFYKTKVALAVVLSLGLAACGDSEGDAGSTSNSSSQTDSTQNTVENQDELTGTVQGVVVDTNGNPVVGIAVYLGNAETVTNAGGQYVFTDVGVTNVNGVNNEGTEADDDVTQTLIITIGGTAEYLGALVTVTPQAQVNNTGGQGAAGGDVGGTGNDNEDATAGDGVNGDNSQVTIQTFVDGFTAEAGIAILPELNAGAYGYIRDCRTGAPLADAADVLSLDFQSVVDDISNAIDSDFANGDQITNSEHTVTIGSDADGMFSLAGLAANSSYSVSPKEGWTITSGTTSFSTSSEGSSEFLATVEVCPVSFTPGANAAPYIKTISNSIDPVADDGFMWSVLKPGIDGTAGKEIVINFNEAMDVAAIDLDKVVITKQVSFTNVSAGELLVDFAVDADGERIISMSEDGKSMTIQLATALPEMTKFSVWMPRWQYMDTYYAGAAEVVTGDNGTGESDPDATANDIVRDDIVSTASGSLDFTGADADLSILAQSAGTNGNSTTVTIVEAGANTVLSVVVSNTTVTVNLATDGSSDSTSTSADVAAAVAASIAANNLVAITASGDGTGIVDAGASVTLTGGGGVINGPIGSSAMGISSDTLNTTEFKTTYVRTRICTFVEVETSVEGVTGEQLIQTLPAAQLPETAATWDNGVNGSGAISNLNGQEDALDGVDTGKRVGARWGITYDNDQAVVTGDLGTLNGVADINVTHFRGSAVQPGSNIDAYDNNDGTYGIDVDNAAHLDVIRLQPTAAFGIVGANIDVDLLDLIAPTTTLQENYGLYAETGYNRDTADSGLVAAGEGGEVSVPGAAAALGDPIVYIQPRHLSPVNASNTADWGDEFVALAGASSTTGNTLPDNTNANPLYHGAEYTAWTDRANPLGFGFSENIYVASGAAIGATADTDLTNASYINSVTRNIDNELTAATGLAADLVTVDVADMVDLANNDHDYVVQFEGLVADKLSSASTGDNTATVDDSARVLLQDAMPAYVTTSRWTGTTVEFTFNEPVDVDGDLASTDTTVFCFIQPATGDVDGDCADGATEYALTLDASLRTDADANNDEDEGAYVLSADGMTLTAYVDGTKVEALMLGTATINPEFYIDDNRHVAVSWDNLADAEGNTWATFDQDINTVAAAASARYIVDAPRFLAYDDVGPFEVTNARFIYENTGGAGDDDGNVTFTITFSHPLDLRNVATPMGAAMITTGGWNGIDRSFDGTVGADFAIIDEMFEIDLDGVGVGGAAQSLDTASGTLDLSVIISADYRTITLVTSEAANAIVALTTDITFKQLLDSSIVNAQWPTLNYKVADTQ